MTDRIAELRKLIAADDAAWRESRNHPSRETLRAYVESGEVLDEALMNALPALLDCAAALTELIAYAKDSQGIAGYHMNGAILEWDDVEELHAGINALARLNGESDEG